jgi:glycosyltransferase involved in cell wall biosynthesis
MDLHMPLITIGMPVYNCESTVAEAIASILNQTFKNWELIVYDDGSQDGTVSVAQRFDDPRIHIVPGKTNDGLPARLNEIVTKCNGAFFARMDGDDIAYPDRLQHQLEYLQNHAEVDLVAGSILVFRSNGVALGVRRGPATHAQICAHPWSGIPMAHPTWMGRTEWFRRNPYNAEKVRMEDWELLFRTYQHSHFANLPEIVLGYREDALSLRKILLARRNRCATLLRSARRECTPLGAVYGIAGQIARSLVDIAAISSRLDYRLLKHRTPRVTSDEIAAWKDVFDMTRDSALEQCVSQEAATA